MSQANNYQGGGGGHHPQQSTNAPTPSPAAAAGPVAVAAMMPQVNNYLQHHSFANHQMQQQQQQQVQQQQQAQHQQVPQAQQLPQQTQQPQQQPQQQQPQPQPQQQFMPGPFYTLQQQQAFAQARLAAAAAQQQQQQLQQQQTAAAQAQQAAMAAAHQQQQQNLYNYTLMGQQHHQQQQQQQQMLSQSSSPSAATDAATVSLGVQQQQQPPVLNFNTNHHHPAAVQNNVAMGGGGGVSMSAAATVTTNGNTSSATTAVAAAPPPPPSTNSTSGRKRKSSPELKTSTNNNKKTPSPSPTAASKPTKGSGTKTTTSKKKSPPSPGLPPTNHPQQSTSESILTSGMSSTAARLIQNAMAESNNCDIPPNTSSPPTSTPTPGANGTGGGADGTDMGRPLTAEEKKQSSRDRNREHARCTRLRKKAYVNKLKELVDGLHAERSEDARKRRVAVQHLAEIQELRRKVVHTFLGYHSKFCEDRSKWNTILESEFWLKQPVTPYRSFRRCEIQKGSRILKGVDAMIRDSASMAVMIETIGSRNLRWLQRKRDDFLSRGNASKHATSAGHRTHRTSHVGSSGTSAGGAMPHSIVRQNSRLQHAVSSLSSSSGSSTGNGSGAEEERALAQRRNKTQGKINDDQHHGHHHTTHSEEKKQAAKKVSSSSSSNDTQQILHNQGSNDFHDYHAPSLPDPLPESGGSSPSSDSRHGDNGMDSDNCVVGGKHMCTDSSSGEEEKKQPATKKRKSDHHQSNTALETMAQASRSTGAACYQSDSAATAPAGRPSSLPSNIARSGGILHNVKAVSQPSTLHAAASSATTSSLPNGHANLSRAPATALPPFVGIGKRKHPQSMNHKSTALSTESHQLKMASSSASKPLSVLVPNPPLPPVAHDPNNKSNDSQEENNNNSNNSNNLSSQETSHHRGNIITIDNDTTTSSQSSSQNQRGIQAHYHINEDDMILTDDVLMCPFIFRSQEAVWSGALAECVQPGMLRACFSSTNKLKNVEMIFDAMGFCQQLERASGNEGMAQIIPNSLEMALAPNSEEARVITLAKPPFRIVSVNEAWTVVTGYTQFDAEGKELSELLYGERTEREEVRSRHMPPHDFENVARGVCAASTNVHRDVNGREFLNFMCSYPLSNLSDEVTHILHVCQELQARA